MIILPSKIITSTPSVPNQVSVLHSSEAGEHVNHMVAPPQYMQVVHHPSVIHDLYPSHSSGKKTHRHMTRAFSWLTKLTISSVFANALGTVILGNVVNAQPSKSSVGKVGLEKASANTKKWITVHN